MIRDGQADGAPYAALLVTPGNGVAFQRRAAAGGPSVYTPADAGIPVWLRLARTGNLFTAWMSPDKDAWTLVGADTVPLATTVSVGLAVTSHANGTTTTATVDNVAITP
ncbi:MAG: hypothetical protein A2W29_12390 [Gemmatimonadetes bacterium RBG_16_66_8]|nr:MAG: hypothetical protein A2W29_12390 [Gemmatimonadetes bacterium RBG_16_66_8]